MIVAVLIILSVSLIFLSAFSFLVINNAKIIKNAVGSRKAYWAGESGLEDAVYRAKNDLPYAANYSFLVGDSNTSIDITSSGNLKTVISSGEYQGMVRKLKAELNITKINPQFYYGAQVGEGGLGMGENSKIRGAADSVGNLYSNGAVSGSNGATITGSVIVATGVVEDNQARSIVCNQDQEVGKNDPWIDFAQSFSPSESKPLAKVSLYLKKIGNPGNRTIRIANDISGSPSDTSLASGTLSASLVGSNYGWIDVAFSSPPDLINGDTYWIILDAARDANKYWIWCKDSNQGYGNGVGKYSEDWDDDPWTQIIGDLSFKTYLGESLSSINSVDVWGDVKANSIINSRICGDAYYQSIDANSLNFLNNPSGPLCPSPLTAGYAYGGQADPPIINMPISQANIEQWKAEAEMGDVINGDCGDSGDPQCVIDDNGVLLLGPKKINGNLILTKKQNLIVTGTIYITGYVDINSSSGAMIKCDAVFGGDSCVVVTDKWVHIQNNASFQGSGQEGSYIMILSALGGCNGGSQTSECTHHNGAIDMHNNATGAIFYASDSMIHLHNGVNVTEIVAYKLSLDNNAIITYEQGLVNVGFSSGPGATFNIANWREVE